MVFHKLRKIVEMLVFLHIFSISVLNVYADTCYKSSGSYVYSTYCSGYCTGTYGDESCIYTYYYYYYYYNTDLTGVLSTGAIVGVVIGSLIALAIGIGIVVAVIKSVSKTGRTSGTIVQPSGTAVTYSTAPATIGGQPPLCNDANNTYLGQPNYPPTSVAYPPISGYPPNTGYQPSSQNATQPPPYTNSEYSGMTPVDSKNSYI